MRDCFLGATITVGVVVAAAAISVSIDPAAAQALSVSAAASAPVPKTPWGEPDLQGIWTEEFDTPFQRPAKYANQEYFTEAQRAGLDLARSELLGKRANDREYAGAPSLKSNSDNAIVGADRSVANREAPPYGECRRFSNMSPRCRSPECSMAAFLGRPPDAATVEDLAVFPTSVDGRSGTAAILSVGRFPCGPDRDAVPSAISGDDGCGGGSS